MDILVGGVTAPKGFVASGIHCGLKKKKEKKDLALIYSEKICDAAAVYTQNKVKGCPILVTEKNLLDYKAQAIIVNSGNANTCTGEDGIIKANKMAELVSERLGISKEDVVVASTGVIGVPLNIEAIESGMDELVNSINKNGNIDAREAIMTTDTIKKEVAVSIKVGDKKVTIGAMAKGSGMIHPNMATMLGFVTTDVSIDGRLLKEALSYATNKSFNRISVDGDTSTNDMVSVLANGMAGNTKITDKDEDYYKFVNALTFVCTELAKLIAKDGEGATKMIECYVKGALNEEHAASLAKTVIQSSLVKTAVFGADANWGRILCALGYSDEPLEVDKVDVSFDSIKGYLEVCKNGRPVPFSEEKAKLVLGESEISIIIDLKMGEEEAVAWGCDLSYEYVRINGDYRT
ncbi:bifunctional glutamate N-acetyltransferase/amino-acid acetyltransferase ArgJ [Clostridium manihotivorum]|uniref:Arginine biosynthesis bifunctional protein ArgJ n=1 Tax=Clostridium manihotivorum TaxID=2320868 RepID=A0A3R5TDR7_9CLOT|nr:bifunctional glutamate N-acetyltransferase/amino-acid acetyltransferase ArgJ [Clostridium manihotivorum]QAA31066.1 arginine biosynthesis protein ArgJ [Clostridium manihotivorum]